MLGIDTADSPKKYADSMFKRPVVLFLLSAWVSIMLLAIVTFPSLATADHAFLDAADAFSLSVQQPASAGQKTGLSWSIAPGYYLYRTRIKAVEEPSKKPVDLVLPPGDQKDDPNFGKIEVYHKAVTTAIPASNAAAFTVTWQGCADAGLCYPPQHRIIKIAEDKTVAADTSASGLAAAIDAAGNSDSGIHHLLNTKALYWTLPVFLLLGIGLAFTPCVLPMLPIVSSIVMGQNTKPKQAFFLSLAFVVPMALVYAGLGVAAATAGANLQAALQNQWAILAFGALFVLLALPMFGIFTLQLPAFLRDRLDHASRQQQQRGRYLGAAGMGVLSALMVGPCMTAPLAGTLLYIAQSGDAVKGGLLLFVMGIGMGLPLIAVSVLGARSLPKPGLWMERVKGSFGFLMLAVAIWMFQRVLPGSLTLLLWGGWLIGIAISLLHITRYQKADQANAARIAAQCVAVLALLWGAAAIFGAAGGATDPLQPIAFASNTSGANTPGTAATAASDFTTVTTQGELERLLAEARTGKQPALVDFYADWCVSCKIIEKEVFGSDTVSRALAGAKLIRVDVTDNNPSVQALMRQKGILGPPTVLFFDGNGNERRDARLVGEFKSGDLLQRLHPGAPGAPS
jgi:thiol:disulfide interchange protein DsbD